MLSLKLVKTNSQISKTIQIFASFKIDQNGYTKTKTWWSLSNCE